MQNSENSRKLGTCCLISIVVAMVLGQVVGSLLSVTPDNQLTVYAVIFILCAIVSFVFGDKIMQKLHLKKGKSDTDKFTEQVITQIRQANGYIAEASKRQYSQIDLEIIKDAYKQLEAYKHECNTGRVHKTIVDDLRQLNAELAQVVPRGKTAEAAQYSQMNDMSGNEDYENDFNTLNNFRNGRA